MKKIAIIGGGASGLLAAWLLEEDFEVVLFEKEEKLGGHAETIGLEIDGKTSYIDCGFELFSDKLFPTFLRLLHILNIPLKDYELSYTFYRTSERSSFALPPFHDGQIHWRVFEPSQLSDLIYFKMFLDKGIGIIDEQIYSVTVQDYADSIGLPESFKNDFLYPFLASGWGVSVADFKGYSAYNILKWYVRNKPAHLTALFWKEVAGGTSAYIEALANQLKRAQIRLCSEITSLAKNGNRYRIATNVQLDEFDHVIIATNAYTGALLLKSVPEATAIRTQLEKIEYMHTTLALHGDRRFMPYHESDWGIVNVAYDGNYSAMTIYKKWRSEVPVFRTWLTFPLHYQEGIPDPLYLVKEYYHAKVTPTYFDVQEKLSVLNGCDNLWIAGLYTHDIDSHESALMSAVSIATKLAPASKRLLLLQSHHRS